MVERGVGAVVVLEGDAIAAILTERDVMKAVAAGSARTLVDFFATTARGVDENGDLDPQTDLFLDERAAG